MLFYIYVINFYNQFMKTKSKKGIIRFCLLIIVVFTFVFFTANAFKNNKSDSSIFYTALLKGPFKPVPLYGSNSINTRGPSWKDEAFADTVASIDFKILRYPGGGFTDY